MGTADLIHPRRQGNGRSAANGSRIDVSPCNGTWNQVREVEPVAFAGTRNQWYLLAWCRLRDSGRAFRVDRILAVADTGQPAPHLDVQVAGGSPRRASLSTALVNLGVGIA